MDAEHKIRRAIVHLHLQVLGQSRTSDHPDVDRTFRLFKLVLEDARVQKGIGKQESYFCGAGKEN